jgi:hypothetical protein
MFSIGKKAQDVWASKVTSSMFGSRDIRIHCATGL